MSYSVNDAKKDPDSGFVALKTGMSDPAKSWLVVTVSDGKTHYVADDDIAAWADLAPVPQPEEPPAGDEPPAEQTP